MFKIVRIFPNVMNFFKRYSNLFIVYMSKSYFRCGRLEYSRIFYMMIGRYFFFSQYEMFVVCLLRMYSYCSTLPNFIIVIRSNAAGMTRFELICSLHVIRQNAFGQSWIFHYASYIKFIGWFRKIPKNLQRSMTFEDKLL